jgi:hypothetical protein
MRVLKPIRDLFLPTGRMPNFFIAGAARCGTTSMWDYLKQHPDIFLPDEFRVKEPSFFCENFGMKSREKYLSLFRNAGDQKLVGEASGPYLTSPEAPARIQAEVPDAKFIIMLRNPAVRAFSLFKWMRANGYEDCADFREALRLEKERMGDASFQKDCPQYFYNFLYFHSGLYAAQVSRFFDTFGRDRVMVVIFEEFIAQPERHVRDAYKFLGVDENFRPKIEVLNASRDGTALEPALRKELLAQYAGDISQLEKLLGRELQSLWN